VARSVAALAAFLVCAGASRVAGAQSSGPLQISWQGPEDCERGDVVRNKVTRLLGGSQRGLGPGISVLVTVRREKGPRYVAELETASDTGRGKKRLEGESCDAIALASAVVIALSVDPQASLDADEPEPAPEPRPKPRPEPRPRRAPPRPVPPERVTSPYLHGCCSVCSPTLRRSRPRV
jgi:hypothetical protein